MANQINWTWNVPWQWSRYNVDMTRPLYGSQQGTAYRYQEQGIGRNPQWNYGSAGNTVSTGNRIAYNPWYNYNYGNSTLNTFAYNNPAWYTPNTYNLNVNQRRYGDVLNRYQNTPANGSTRNGGAQANSNLTPVQKLGNRIGELNPNAKWKQDSIQNDVKLINSLYNMYRKWAITYDTLENQMNEIFTKRPDTYNYYMSMAEKAANR